MGPLKVGWNRRQIIHPTISGIQPTPKGSSDKRLGQGACTRQQLDHIIDVPSRWCLLRQQLCGRHFSILLQQLLHWFKRFSFCSFFIYHLYTNEVGLFSSIKLNLQLKRIYQRRNWGWLGSICLNKLESAGSRLVWNYQQLMLKKYNLGLHEELGPQDDVEVIKGIYHELTYNQPAFHPSRYSYQPISSIRSRVDSFDEVWSIKDLCTQP